MPDSPVTHLRAFGQKRDGSQAGFEAEFVQHADAVRAQLDAGADFTKARRLFEHMNVHLAPRQRQRARQAANSAAGDQDPVSNVVGQVVRVSGKLRRREPVAAKIAFATAGAIGGVPGSPIPVGLSVFCTTNTSTIGISFIRSSG